MRTIKRIQWKKGASSAICYLATIWLMVLAIILFLENYNAFSKVGKTQLFADLVSDGSCFIADNGWGLVEKNAVAAKNKLIDLNKEEFKDITISNSKKGFRLAITDENDEETKNKAYKDHGNSVNNTVFVAASLKSTTLTTDAALKATRNSSTKITYSGGLRIVREAWIHTYQYNPSTQTPYVWGGGHGDGSLECLEPNAGADCSGFVSAIFRKCGYASIVGTSCTGTLETCGRTIADGSSNSVFDNARPGDIILYWWSGNQNGASQHVAIYAGYYNGKHWQIESHGGPANNINNKGRGESYGVNINEVSTDRANRIKVQRIVNSDGTGEEVKDTNIAGLSIYESVVARAFLEAEYSKAQVAGILGNWRVESGGCIPYLREGLYGTRLNESLKLDDDLKHNRVGRTAFIVYGIDRGFIWPETGQARPEGYGLAQWTSESRRAGLWDTAEAMGTDPSDIYAQIAYALYEMKQNTNSYIDKEYKKKTDPKEAAFYYLKNFEGIVDESKKVRENYASDVYTMLNAM